MVNNDEIIKLNGKGGGMYCGGRREEGGGRREEGGGRREEGRGTRDEGRGTITKCYSS